MKLHNFEEELQYLQDVVESGEFKDWQQAVDDLGLNMHPDSLRKSWNVGKYCGYQVTRYFQNKLKELNGNTITEYELEQLEEARKNLLKERKKLQTVNLEYQKNLREEARFEMFLENIEEAVCNLEPIKIKNSISTKRNSLEKTGVLFVSDAHYGREVELKGLFGETINIYNPKEFKTRMWYLLNQLENDFKIMPIDKLNIIDCGDAIEGILRLGESLKNLKSGVVQSAIEYAEFMATWIIECYNRLQIPVEYGLTSGNHDILRVLESKSNFEEETVAKFIYNHINLRIENSKLKSKLDTKREVLINLKPYNDVLYNSYYGLNLLVYHGETKNMKTDIEFFEDYYNIDIDILVGGHFHRGSNETVGIGYLGDREIIRVPSICGTDTYSKKIRGNARAGAKYIIFDEYGKNWEKTYFLN